MVQDHQEDFENEPTTSLFEVHKEDYGILGILGNHADQGCPIEGATCLDVKHDDRRRLA